MRILALETTSSVGGVALVDGERLVAASALDGGKGGHTRWLLGAVERMLLDARIAPDTIDAVAVNVGPGSFTGIRIGLATAQGLAFGWGKPVVAVPGLEALAWQAAAPARPGAPMLHRVVLSLIDARHGNAYGAAYRWHDGGESGDGDAPDPGGENCGAGPRDGTETGAGEGGDGYPVPQTLVEPGLWSAEEFFEAVKAALTADGPASAGPGSPDSETIALAGDGGVLYERMAQRVLGSRVRPVALGAERLRAETVARWAERRGPAVHVPPEAARPLYFRKSEAERKWAQPVHP